MRKRVLGNVVERRKRRDGWNSGASYTSGMVNVFGEKSEKNEKYNAKIFTCTILV